MKREEILEKLLKDITLEQARNYKKICMGLNTTSVVLASFCLANPAFLIGFTPAVLATLSSKELMKLLNIDNYDYLKDVKELKILYDEVLINFNELKNDFNFNNNIELCTFLNYCVRRGFLSHDKNYEFNGKETVDIHSVMGAYLMAGKGVCRHISALYRDILNINGIDNCLVYVNTMNVLELNELIEDLNLKLETNPKMFLIKQRAEEMLEIEKNKKIKNEKISNHVINLVKDDNLVYYLDPTQSKMYVNSDSEYLISNVNKKIKVADVSMKHKDSKNFKIYKSLSKVEVAKIELFDKQKVNVLNICDNNMDLLEKFNHENNELFSEIKTEVEKLKNKTKIKFFDYIGS